MKYEIKQGELSDISFFISCKFDTIVNDSVAMSLEEQQKVLTYIKAHIQDDFSYYQKIIVGKKRIGMLVVRPYEDGNLLDEIYLISSFRHQKIGSQLLKHVITGYSHPIYLWVYQTNQCAISLYQKFNFKIILKTDSRFLMKLL